VVNHPRTFHFRSVLTLVILSLLVGSMVLIGVVSLLYAKHSVDDLAGAVMLQAASRVSARLEQFFAQAADESAFCEQLLSGQNITAADFPSLARQILPTLERRRDLTRVYFGRQNTNQPGEYFMLERDGGELRLREGLNVGATNRLERLFKSDTHRWLPLTNQLADSYDPRSRPFFRQAQATGKSGWTPAYEFWSLRAGRTVTGITYTAPVWDAVGDFAGAVGVDLETGVLNSFLRKLDSEMAGFAFVMEATPAGQLRVVAHPDPPPAAQSATNPLALGVKEFFDPVVVAMFTNLPDSFEELAGRGPQAFEFLVNGEHYWGSCARPASGTRWLVGIAVPRIELTSWVRYYAIWYVIVFLAVLVAAILAILQISHRAAQPLRQLHRDAEAVGRLEFAASAESPTRIFEIGQLAGAMARMKSNLRSFQKYVPAEVVGDLVRSGHEATLGGENILASIYFSDIADFTVTSEQLAPEALVAHLGCYLSAMSEGIAHAGGTVDKFIGDAVMAFWNAPRRDAAHALHACEAALANLRRLEELQISWRANQQPLFHTRIGLHTGPVIVGNIGSEWRMNYTIIGDSVNLASRLEALNKFYRTRIIVSAATVAAAGDRVVTRPLDQVNVKGKSTGVIVHELLALQPDATDLQRELSERTTAAFAAYRARDFALAQKIYADLLGRFPNDHAAEILRQRSHAFTATPPPEDWDGVYRVSS
jgi:adenylate cyclase